jgi:hypothetical protein
MVLKNVRHQFVPLTLEAPNQSAVDKMKIIRPQRHHSLTLLADHPLSILISLPRAKWTD